MVLNQETLSYDVTDFGVAYELYKSYSERGDNHLAKSYLSQLKELLRGNHHNYMELAIDYGYVGLYTEAIDVLSLYENECIAYPMISYYKAYYLGCIGDLESAKKQYQLASLIKPDYCFPNHLESILVLSEAIVVNPSDAKAPYYLANLYYDKKQYGKAIELWEESCQRDNSYPTAYRNLALAYINKSHYLEKGLKYLEKAFELDQSDARVLFELDQLYKKLQRPYEQRMSFLNQHKSVVKMRDDLFVEYVTLYNNMGHYQSALELIDSRVFHPWEGGEGKVIRQYKLCRIELAKQSIEKGQLAEAMAYLKACTIFPYHLGEGKLPGTAENDVLYYMGVVNEQMNNHTTACLCFEQATLGLKEPTDMMFYNDQPADMMFYQGLAFEQLGRSKEAKSMFNKLYDYGEKHINDQKVIDYFAVSLPDFMVFEEDLNYS